MAHPIQVLISDVHYNINTLPLADAAMRLAIAKANELDVSLTVCGDLHDTKANLRGECVNAMLETFSQAHLGVTILIGNHDKINEKGDTHSLNFLKDTVNFIVTVPQKFSFHDSYDYDYGYLVPYYSDVEALRACLKTLPKGSRLIMHQGLKDSNSGDYIQDKTALTKADVAGFRVISGHYHQRQTIALPDGGTWDFLGNPYTLNSAEANDPSKGFQVLYSDGSLEFVPTNLRKHVVINLTWGQVDAPAHNAVPGDIVRVKFSGPSDKLSTVSKEELSSRLGIKEFRLDLQPTDVQVTAKPSETVADKGALLDDIIDELTNTDESRKKRIKGLWKDLITGV